MSRPGRRTASLILALLLAAACRKQEAAPPGPMTLAVPAQGAYTGAFIEFGDTEDDVTLDGIEEFEKLVGKHQAIIASSSYWGEQSFPTANVNLIFRHGSIPLIFWSPWNRPYQEDLGPDKFSLNNIADGKWDAYIDKWGEAAHAFGHPMLVSFGNEMNGDWFPWSGGWYHGNQPVPGTKPAQYQGAELFKRAYRRVVDRVRAKGGANVLWVFHVMNYSYPQDGWNMASQYYPGPDYVDWLGLSVYGEQYMDDPWEENFAPLLDWPYDELCKLDPNKPIMLTEWGIGEYPMHGNKAKFMKGAFEDMRTKTRLKAAIYWNERWENEDDSYSNLRVNSTVESLAVYRSCVGQPFWLGSPILAPRAK